MFRIDRKRARELHFLAVRIRMRQHEARHAVSQRRFSDAARPADQPGVRDPAAAIGLEQYALCLRMPEQLLGFAWMQAVTGLLVIIGAHGAALSALGATAAGFRRVS